MKHNILRIEPFTQKELTKYFNISNPPICDIHNRPARVYYEDGMFKLDVCCDNLIHRVRIQIFAQMSKKHV